MPEPSDYWVEFRDRLHELGDEPVLIGALAASLYRTETRRTTDVDFLGEDGRPYVAYIRGHGHRVDAIVAETAYQHEAIDRATGGVLTVEDVIVHKLLAWRPRDRDDISSILSAGPTLDSEYIERWATSGT